MPAFPLLYEQVARVAKAMASPKRLELIELLCQGEKRVERLVSDTGMTLKLVSAHLRDLRQARLVDARREGKFIFYRLADARVAVLLIVLRETAEARLLELQQALREHVLHPDESSPLTGRELLRRAREGEVVVIDVRPVSEYEEAHIPTARSLPLPELKNRLKELPAGLPVVAYCRGPLCVMATQAIRMLRKEGWRASRLPDGVAEWRAQRLPLESRKSRSR